MVINDKPFIILFLILLMLTIFKFHSSAEEYDLNVPTDVVEASEEIGKMYDIAPTILQAIAWRESRYNETIESKNGEAIGICQIVPRWHEERISRCGMLVDVYDLKDMKLNMCVAADYIMELAEKYDDIGIVLMVYHGEADALEKADAGIISSYANEILEMSLLLEEQKGVKDDSDIGARRNTTSIEFSIGKHLGNLAEVCWWIHRSSKTNQPLFKVVYSG